MTKYITNKLVTSELYHAFNGEILANENESALENNYSGYRYFRVIILQLDNFAKIQQESTSADISRVMLIIKSICLEKAIDLNPSIACPQPDCIGMVLASHTSIDSFVKSLNEIQKYAEDMLSITLTCTISDEITDAAKIPNLCRNVFLLKEQRFFTGFNSIIDISSIINNNDAEYPAELETKIIQALDANKFDECYRYIEQFIQIIHNCNANSAQSYINIQFVQKKLYHLHSFSAACPSGLNLCSGIIKTSKMIFIIHHFGGVVKTLHKILD